MDAIGVSDFPGGERLKIRKQPAEKVAKTTTKPDLKATPPGVSTERPSEFGGPKGLEPTRYGDWERRGRCIDF